MNKYLRFMLDKMLNDSILFFLPTIKVTDKLFFSREKLLDIFNLYQLNSHCTSILDPPPNRQKNFIRVQQWGGEREREKYFHVCISHFIQSPLHLSKLSQMKIVISEKWSDSCFWEIPPSITNPNMGSGLFSPWQRK